MVSTNHWNWKNEDDFNKLDLQNVNLEQSLKIFTRYSQNNYI